MPVNIHGKQYKTVAERLNEFHKDFQYITNVSITTEVLTHSPVVVKATIKFADKTFTGISAANEAKAIEKASPYEVAETSAVGRALAFAGYAGDEIASAEELDKAINSPMSGNKVITRDPKVESIPDLFVAKGEENQDKCEVCGASKGTHSPTCWRNPKNIK